LTGAEQPEFDRGWEALYFCLDEQFVMTASEQSISRFERIVGISPRPTDTLDDRRFAILAAMANEIPYTIRWLRARLYALLGDKIELDLDHDNYHLQARIALQAKRQFDLVLNLLRRVVPANITLDASLDYRRHGMLTRFRHRELKPYTHEQIRRGLELDE